MSHSSHKPSKITNSSEFNTEIKKIETLFKEKETEYTWESFENAIKNLTAWTRGGAHKFDGFVPAIKNLKDPLKNSISTDRTRLSGSATELIEVLATTLHDDFAPLADIFLPTLLKLCSRANKVFVTRATQCIIAIITNVKVPHALPKLSDPLEKRHANKVMRQSSAEFLCKMLETYEVNALEASIENLEKTIKIGLEDAAPEVRTISRKCCEVYCHKFGEKAQIFVNALPAEVKKHLKLGPAKSTMAKLPSSRRPTLTTKNTNNLPRNANKTELKTQETLPIKSKPGTLDAIKVPSDLGKENKKTKEPRIKEAELRTVERDTGDIAMQQESLLTPLDSTAASAKTPAVTLAKRVTRKDMAAQENISLLTSTRPAIRFSKDDESGLKTTNFIPGSPSAQPDTGSNLGTIELAEAEKPLFTTTDLSTKQKANAPTSLTPLTRPTISTSNRARKMPTVKRIMNKPISLSTKPNSVASFVVPATRGRNLGKPMRPIIQTKPQTRSASTISIKAGRPVIATQPTGTKRKVPTDGDLKETQSKFKKVATRPLSGPILKEGKPGLTMLVETIQSTEKTAMIAESQKDTIPVIDEIRDEDASMEQVVPAANALTPMTAVAI